MPWISVSCVCLIWHRNRMNATAVAPNLLDGEPGVPARLSISHSRVQPAALGPAHAPALQEVIDQLARGVIHLHVEGFHATGQVVEHHDGRNRHEQADGGGYK